MTEPNEKPQPKTVAELYEAALKLSDVEREKLHLMLLCDDDQSAVDPGIERAAIAECERRDALVRAGKMELVDADDVVREARKIIG